MDARSQPVGVTGQYHEQTKYHAATIHTLQRPLQQARVPEPYNEPDDVPLVDLTTWLPSGDEWQSDLALASYGNELDAGARERTRLSLLLYLAYGITGIIRTPTQQFLMRAAPSAGALYPADLYLVVGPGTSLEAGVYLYQSRQHVLAKVADAISAARWAAARFAATADTETRIWVVLAGHFPRSSWRYQARAYRRVLLDAGHLWGNLMSVSSLVGYAAEPMAAFQDQLVNELLGLQPGLEGSLLVLGLRDGADSPVWGGCFPEIAEPASSRLPEPLPEDPDACIWLAHEAGNLYDAPLKMLPEPVKEPLWLSLGALVRLPETDVGWNDKLGVTLLKRRSARAFSNTTWSQPTLGIILQAAYRDARQSDLLDLVKTYIVVHAVDGLDAGAYHYDPISHTLRQTRFRNLKEACGHLALGQALAEDAAAVVFHTANLGLAQARFGERAYRYLHMVCGAIGQMLNLYAVKHDMGASGIGGFFDDEVNDTLGIPDDEAVLYITTLGVPRNSD